MVRKDFFCFSEKDTKLTFFVFFSLFILNTAFFVFADDTIGTQNIFQDSDQDGLSNDEEKLYGTDPFVKDTDQDGYGDGIEVESGYDPLKPAPGDKVIQEVSKIAIAANVSSENLTQKASDEIVNILKNTGDGSVDISLEDVNESVQKILSESTTEIIFPDVDIESIKIKTLPKKLKGDDRASREQEDAVEYLTVIAYLMANNAPRNFQTEDELGGMLAGISNDSVSAILSGNMDMLHQLSGRGEKIVEELKNIEVPEKMLDTHIKALKMTKYALQLKGDLVASQADPFGQIAVLSKVQGFLGSATLFMEEVHQKLTDYGIQEIPIDL